MIQPERQIYDNILCSNMVQPERPIYGNIIGKVKMRFACRKSKAHVQTNALAICNTYCFYTARMIRRTRNSTSLYAHCLSCCVKRLQHRTSRFCILRKMEVRVAQNGVTKLLHLSLNCLAVLHVT